MAERSRQTYLATRLRSKVREHSSGETKAVDRNEFLESKVRCLEQTISVLQDDRAMLQAQLTVYNMLLNERREQWKEAHMQDPEFDDGILAEDTALEEAIVAQEWKLAFLSEESQSIEDLEKEAGPVIADRREAVKVIYEVLMENGASALALFKRVDANESGFLDLEELRRCLLMMKVHINEAELHMLFSDMDADGNGRIDYKELKDHVIMYAQEAGLTPEAHECLSPY